LPVLVPVLYLTRLQGPNRILEFYLLKGVSQGNHFKHCKIMKIKDAVGIDMSKLTFDATIHSSQVDREFDNDKKDYKKLIDWTYKNSDLPKENIIFVFEHTGLYSHGLSVYLASKNIPFLLVPGLEIRNPWEWLEVKAIKLTQG